MTAPDCRQNPLATVVATIAKDAARLSPRANPHYKPKADCRRLSPDRIPATVADCRHVCPPLKGGRQSLSAATVQTGGLLRKSRTDLRLLTPRLFISLPE